ncbi:hypothetical protein QBC35DRAFT_483482 [Podospora australis]|uniref:Secreted protein n=1 Tax=Podospora australis TaxID=1536484 RepID=A0AAN6X3R3_9PEZI|nr:hypothetical protein QBC35DRAFT_483482 [Podospora australis]
MRTYEWLIGFLWLARFSLFQHHARGKIWYVHATRQGTLHEQVQWQLQGERLQMLVMKHERTCRRAWEWTGNIYHPGGTGRCYQEPKLVMLLGVRIFMDMNDVETPSLIGSSLLLARFVLE